MSGAEAGLALSVFLASTVEAVEALTIVLAVGQTRSWFSALSGAGVAAVALAAAVALLGTALADVPLDELRKAVLRAAGLKALHDELGTYEHESAAALAAGSPHGRWDGYSFAVALKGVLIEGLEVAVIVVTFGASKHRYGIAAAAAAVAVAVVVAAGFAVRAPLARVPENTMKYAVGVMLCAFGVFWAGEGAGVAWPGGDAILLALVAAILAASLVAVSSLRRIATR